MTDEQTKALARIETALRSMKDDLVEIHLFDESKLGLLHGTDEVYNAKQYAIGEMESAINGCETLLGVVYTKTRLAAESGPL